MSIVKELVIDWSLTYANAPAIKLDIEGGFARIATEPTDVYTVAGIMQDGRKFVFLNKDGLVKYGIYGTEPMSNLGVSKCNATMQCLDLDGMIREFKAVNWSSSRAAYLYNLTDIPVYDITIKGSYGFIGMTEELAKTLRPLLPDWLYLIEVNSEYNEKTLVPSFSPDKLDWFSGAEKAGMSSDVLKKKQQFHIKNYGTEFVRLIC